MRVYIISGCIVGLLAALYYTDWMFTMFTLGVHFTVATLAMYLGVSWALVRGKQYSPPSLPKELKTSHVRMVLQNIMVRYEFLVSIMSLDHFFVSL